MSCSSHNFCHLFTMTLLFYNLTVLLALCSLLLVNGAEDYYQLLGISRDATTREIRQAFKKLALNLHPDKNQDDPSANEKFIKVNKAYETLKDEENRKKYDLYGEEGLQDDFHSRGFRSWNYYYENFGIYDDDPEIITLSKSDFEQSVIGTTDSWFINFYSPQCSHCHTLAPAWREMARELDGVIRVGAVNCEEDWSLCRQQGVSSYPSLLRYPQGEKYRGERTTSALVNYVLQHLSTSVIELWDGNFNKFVDDTEYPWLIFICWDDGDCPLHETKLKVAAMLEGLANVGNLDCSQVKTICEQLDSSSSETVYYTKVGKGLGKLIASHDAKDIARMVLEFLPELVELDELEFTKIYKLLQQHQELPWLIVFIDGKSGVDDLQLRKLPALLPSMKVGKLDCTRATDSCLSFFIRKYPTFVVFKDRGKYEIYHGRRNAHDIASFSRESLASKVEVLGPSDFPKSTEDGEAWFIDFYAPWCPPCMQLLPEWRKASRSSDFNIHFGTVDCTIHKSLCQKYNIQSYPTSILYNRSVGHQYFGRHSAEGILEFVEDILFPPVISLTEHTFESQVERRASSSLWVIDFFAPWCQPCRELAPQWRKLAKVMKTTPNVHVGQVDCTTESNLCNRLGVRSYPTMRLYPTGELGLNTFYIYNGWRDVANLRTWVLRYVPSKVTDLDDESLSKALKQSKHKAWVIDFFTPWCHHCQVFSPEFETVAQTLDKKVNFGKVDCQRHPGTCQLAGIHQYPTVKMYINKETADLGELIDSQDSATIIDFIEQQLRLTSILSPRDEL